jgi:hypothetical protein
MSAASRSPWQEGEAAADIDDVCEHVDDIAAVRDYQARWLTQRLDTWKPIGLLLADLIFAVAPR